MTTENFESLQKTYLYSKKAFDDSLRILLSENPNFTRDSINDVIAKATKFFTDFEAFLANISSDKYTLTKVQIQDVLTSIENILDASFEYWNTIGDISEKVLDYRHKPQSNFLKTAQGILRTYDKKKAETYRKKFLKNDLPANGFESKEKYKLTTSLIDWVLVAFGVLFFAISSGIVFLDFIETGMQYFLTRIFISLGVAFLIVGLSKHTIQAQFYISKVRITAVGIPALFLIIYFLNPAEVPKYEKTISENKKLEGGM